MSSRGFHFDGPGRRTSKQSVARSVEKYPFHRIGCFHTFGHFKIERKLYFLTLPMERISFNKTKIVATVGPASNNKEMLQALVKEGVDVFRLNFSHGTHADHSKVIKYVREINKEIGSQFALLQDLQ